MSRPTARCGWSRFAAGSSRFPAARTSAWSSAPTCATRLGEAADAQLRFAKLPEGLRPVGAEDAVHLAGDQRYRLEVSFTGPRLPTTPAGKMDVPLELSVGQRADQKVQPLAAQVPLVVCPPVSSAPTVDGDLADWPARPGCIRR